MSQKKRAETLRILVKGHSALTSSARLADILGELERIGVSGRFAARSGWLLTVIHTTRALDTTLCEVVKSKGWWNQNQQSLGAYLRALHHHNILSQIEKSYYQTNVVDVRNTYMHQAGAIPNKIEADTLLTEMHACITDVLGRV